MARFDSAIALAKKLIAKNGQTVTLRIFDPEEGADPNKPWRPGPNTAIDQPIEAVFLDYDQKYIDGELIRRGDQRAFLPAEGLDLPPTVDGVILRGAETWKIVSLETLSPNGQTIMYEAQVRR